jgi:hypothetical protein
MELVTRPLIHTHVDNDNQVIIFTSGKRFELVGICQRGLRGNTNVGTKRRASLPLLNQTKPRGFGPQANYADRATAACWRTSANF